MTYRCDRLAWVYAVLSDKTWWCFRGIERPTSDVIRWHNHPRVPSKERNKLASTLTGSSRYMDDLGEAELKYQIEEDVYADEWAEHVLDVVHEEGCCPNSKDAKERKEFKQRQKALLKDVDKKYDWLRERFDWDWLIDFVVEECTQWQFVEGFLKEHPIEGLIMEHEHLALDEIVGFCPRCDRPATKDDLRMSTDGSSVLDHLQVFDCVSCCEKFVVDECEADKFIEEHRRPFNWPPGAPYPPRRGFLGEPMEAPPWEE